jgi:uncharacterized protein with PIN domain
MVTAIFRFHNDLGFFLAHHTRGRDFPYSFEADQSLKHLIEALGVPHTELGKLEINGSPAVPNALLQEGNRVDVFAAGSQGEEDLRFILDNHLGRLAAYLRVMGFDSLYRNDYGDPELVETASEQERILITRDRRLLMHNRVTQGYCPRSLEPETQLQEVIKRYGITREKRSTPRCLKCNMRLEPVNKESVIERLEPLTRKYFKEFSTCPSCKRVYWKGSHWERMERMIEKAIGDKR